MDSFTRLDQPEILEALMSENRHVKTMTYNEWKLTKRLAKALRNDARGRGKDPSDFGWAKVAYDFVRTSAEPDVLRLVEELEEQVDEDACTGPEAETPDSGEIDDRILNLSAQEPLPDWFEKEWNKVLASCREELRAQFRTKGRSEKQAEKLVRDGWVTVSRKDQKLIGHLAKPKNSEHPIASILVNESGLWLPPSGLLDLIKLHPFVKKIADQIPKRSLREEILRKTNWAKTIKGPASSELARELAWAGERLELLVGSGGPHEVGRLRWLVEARKCEQFWQILDAAIGFGRALAQHDILESGDGAAALEMEAIRGKGRKPETPRLVVDGLVDEYQRRRGSMPTATGLMEFAGGTRGTRDTDQIDWPERWLGVLSGVGWKLWKQTVRDSKQAKKLRTT